MSKNTTQSEHKTCVLVTGSGGRLGRLLRAARDRNQDRAEPLQHKYLFQSRSAGADIQWSTSDLAHGLPPVSAVIALWGATSGTTAELSANADLVDVGITLAHELGASRMIHLSSAGVYGSGHAMNEDHPIGNCGEYGKSKINLEDAVRVKGQTDHIEHLCMRLANVVGADSLRPALKSKGPATIHDFGHQQGPLRSYIGAGDLLNLFDALLLLPPGAWPCVLNVASPHPISMDALISAVGNPITWQKAPAAATAEATLDTSRLRDLLPDFTFKTSACDLISEWQRLDAHT